MSNRLKTLFKEGSKIFFSTIILIIILEIVCRVLVWNQFSPYHTNLNNQGKHRWINDNTLHWTNRPFYLEYNHSFQFNEEGMRVNPKDVFMPKKGKNDFWVFLFGGSAMAGTGSNKNGQWFDITGVHDHPLKESIDGYLEEFLQHKMPNKKVRVFNTAVAMHGVLQSHQRYKMLQHYNPDWIISMDGVNEPYQLPIDKSANQFLEEQWKSHPTQNMPLTRTFDFMSNSAIYFKLGKLKYHYLDDKKMKEKEDSLQFNRNYWSKIKTQPLLFETTNQQVLQNSVDTFIRNIRKFKEYLTLSNQKHLLLIQPYMALRDTTHLKRVETAVYNYFSEHHSVPEKNLFIKTVYNHFKSSKEQIYLMESVHLWKDWVFVDYCHFTNKTNKKIAQEIGKHILTEGEYAPFKINTDLLNENQTSYQ